MSFLGRGGVTQSQAGGTPARSGWGTSPSQDGGTPPGHVTLGQVMPQAVRLLWFPAGGLSVLEECS